MSKESVANVFVLFGVLILSIGGWLVSPALGLTVLGIAAIAIGVGIVRSIKL
ncbi:hypothetical protein M0R72_10340 [Candidatus Pacearchaeota archaeon]|jgi:uncharacterized membrane protein|nr:hypothetical protein [Candidatus Pacearchaeota archaeon]